MPARQRHSRRFRSLSRALVAATAIVLAFVVPMTSSAAVTTSTQYVALGDSYSSGVGAGDYIPASGSCDRSPHAYSALWAAQHPTTAYVSVACSGATSVDVVNNQLSALGTGTTLVSVTMGGNDVGFSSVMQTCVLQSTATCLSAVATAQNLMTTLLPGRLATALAAIKTHAPSARVVILGYPRLYDLNNSWFCPGLSTDDRTALNGAADKLDTTVQAAAASAGVTFADVRSKFEGHELCDFTNNWLHSVNITDISESYHPTATGHSSGYFPVFSSVAP